MAPRAIIKHGRRLGFELARGFGFIFFVMGQRFLHLIKAEAIYRLIETDPTPFSNPSGGKAPNRVVETCGPNAPTNRVFLGFC